MDPITLSSLIGVGSSLVSNIFGKSSQDSANKVNQQEAQLNREFQERMWDKQMAYNDPKLQVQRLREAGLNPAFALGQVASGQVSSSSPNGAQANVNPYNYNFQGVADAGQYYINNLMAMEKNKAEVDSLQLNNEYNRASFAVRLAQAKDNARSAAARADIDEIQRNWEDSIQMSNFQLNWQKQQTEYAHAENLMAQTMMLKQELSFLPTEQRLRAANIAAHTAMLKSQKNLSDKEAKTEFYRMYNEYYHGVDSANKIKLINQNWDKINDIIDNYSSTSNPYFQMLNNMLPSFNFGLDFTNRTPNPRMSRQTTYKTKGRSTTEYYYE